MATTNVDATSAKNVRLGPSKPNAVTGLLKGVSTFARRIDRVVLCLVVDTASPRDL